MSRREFRKKILRSFGAGNSVLDELLSYNESAFVHGAINFPPELPLPDESFIPAWERYCAAAEPGRIFEYLKDRLVQLRFPIRTGISGSETYRRAKALFSKGSQIP